MRRLVYLVASTADGFIAHSDGSFEGFPGDEAYLDALREEFPETFPAVMRPGTPNRSDNRWFDAVLMGRKTYEAGLGLGIVSPYPTLDQYVFSRSLPDSASPEVTVVREDAVGFVARLKKQSGKAIWLCGGAELAATLFAASLVDDLIVKLNPVLFGTGVPLLAGSPKSVSLELGKVVRYPSGHVRLHYAVRA